MKVNPEYNKILAEALVKEDARKESVPMSVIEDIKAELTKDYVDDNPDNFRYTTVMLKDVLAIIDKHISGKEN